jgi:DNA-binding MarR family transcriptional regulator
LLGYTNDVPEISTGELVVELKTAVARLYSRFRSVRGEGELGEAAIAVLTELDRQGPLSLGELSGLAHVTPGSMSQTVNRLTEGGLAVRGADPADRRRVLFTITRQGRAVVAKARTRSHQWLTDRLDTLTPAQRSTLARAAAILRQLAD